MARMYESDEKDTTGAPKLKSKEEPKKEKKGLDPEFLKDMAAGKLNTDAPKKEEAMSSMNSADLS